MDSNDCITHSPAKPRRCNDVGFTTFISVACPLEGVPAGATEDAECLLLHYRMVISSLKQLLHYSILPSTYPWKSILLLSPDEAVRQQTLADMRLTSERLEEFERCGDPRVQALKRSLILNI
jgi:hypothetical protein